MSAQAHEDALFSAWEDVLAAPAQAKVHVVFVLGRDGGGKTSLLDALVKRVRAGGRQQIVTASWAPGGDFLEPLLETVDGRLLRGRLISKTKHQLLSRSSTALSFLPVPHLASHLLDLTLNELLEKRTPLDIAINDRELQGAYAWRMRELCAAKPRLAVLDNAERLVQAGPSSWRFFGELCGLLAGLPALFVVACRTADDTRALIARSFRPGSYRVVELTEHEAVSEATATARQLLAGHPAEHVDALVRLTHGDGRALRQAIDAVLAEGWRGVIDGLVQREIGGWDQRQRQVAEFLAASPEPDERIFDTDAFHRYWNLGGREIRALIRGASDTVTLAEIRDALLAGLSDAAQREDHRAHAVALMEAFERTPDVGLLDAAAREFRLAGDEARWASATTCAARLYDDQDRAAEALARYRALDAAGIDDRQTRLEVLLLAADAAYRIGDLNAVAELTARLDGAGASSELTARAALLRAQVLIHGANADRGRAAIDLLDAVLAAGDPRLEARARCEKAFCLVTSDAGAALLEAERGVAAARREGVRADELYGLHLLGEVLARSGGDAARAERCLSEVAGADEAGPRLRAQATDSLANLYARTGRHVEAERRFTDARELKSGLGDHRGLAITTGGLARLYHRWGKLAEAASYYELDLDLIAEHTPNDVAAFVQVNNLRAEIARMAGDGAGARRMLDSSLARLDELSADVRARAEGYTRLLGARLALDDGRHEAAAADLATAVVAFAAVPALRAEVQIELARVALAHGSTVEALALLDAARTGLVEPYARFQLEWVAIAAGEDAVAARARAAEIARLLDNTWMAARLRT